MRIVKTQVVTGMIMPGGWHFLQFIGPTPNRIEAGSYEELLGAVQEFRLSNGLPLGDIQGDVDKFICTSFPTQCRTPKQASVITQSIVPPPTQTRFIDKIVQWALGLMRTKTFEFVPISEADSRAQQCVKCKHNANWQTSGCGRCNADAQRLLMLLRKGRDVSSGRKLFGCDLHEHDNRSAVWLVNKQSRSERAPANCWV